MLKITGKRRNNGESLLKKTKKWLISVTKTMAKYSLRNRRHHKAKTKRGESQRAARSAGGSAAKAAK